MLAQEFDDEWSNIVFVGRVITNKKIEDLIRSFHAYHTIFNPRSRLIIVGAYSGFERYLASLNHLAASLDATHVHFVGHVTDEELVAFYENRDLFLCASEHEGFCVPLVEAFYKEVPVLAYAATAVPATMDGAGVLYHDKTPAHVAHLMDAILSNAALRGPHHRGSARRGGSAAAARISRARCSASSTTSWPNRVRPNRGS
jgi:glycosyltransferase involved in cell wall biosynthesis